MRAIVFYYSRTGTTKAVASAISGALKCDAEEIVDCKGRSGPLGHIKSGREAHEMRLTEIKHVKNDLSLYDTVIIGTPVWSGTISCAVRTFISQFQQALASKNLAFFCTMGGSGNEDTLEEMAVLCDRAPLATSAFSTGEVKSKKFLAPVSQFTSEILRFLQF